MADREVLFYQTFLSSPNSHPNPPSQPLQISNDGQVLVVTRKTIYILTPSLGQTSDLPISTVHHNYFVGVNGTTESKTQDGSKRQGAEKDDDADVDDEDEWEAEKVKGKGKGKGKEDANEGKATNNSKPDGPDNGGNAFAMSKTTLGAPTRKELTRWELHSNDPRVASQGMSDPYWRAATWSPSGISSCGSSLLATLTDNHDAIVYSPTQNMNRGEWKASSFLTPYLLSQSFSSFPYLLSKPSSFNCPRCSSSLDEPTSSSEASYIMSSYGPIFMPPKCTCGTQDENSDEEMQVDGTEGSGQGKGKGKGNENNGRVAVDQDQHEEVKQDPIGTAKSKRGFRHSIYRSRWNPDPSTSSGTNTGIKGNHNVEEGEGEKKGRTLPLEHPTTMDEVMKESNRDRVQRIVMCKAAMAVALSWSSQPSHIATAAAAAHGPSTSSSSPSDRNRIRLNRRDRSLLVLGHKSGHLSFWRHSESGKMECQAFLLPPGVDEYEWVNGLAWMSDWETKIVQNEQGGRDAILSTHLAFSSTPSGRVHVIKVSQTEALPENHAGADRPSNDRDQRGKITLSFEDAIEVCEKDERPVLGMQWVQFEEEVANTKRTILAYAKTGLFNLVFWCDQEIGTSEEKMIKKTIRLPRLGGDWDGRTAWAPVVGISYVPTLSALLVTLSSSFSYIVTLTCPSSSSSASSPLAPDPGVHVASSDSLTHSLRRWFEQIEREKISRGVAKFSKTPVRKEDTMRCWGSWIDGGLVWWIHQKERPKAFTYHPDSTLKTTLVLTSVSQIPGFQKPEDILRTLQEIVTDPPCFLDHAASHVLWPFLLHFRECCIWNSLDTLSPFLKVLRPSRDAPQALEEKLFSTNSQAFVRHIYEDERITSLGLKEILTRFLLLGCISSPNPAQAIYTKIEILWRSLAVALNTSVLRSLVEFLEIAKGGIRSERDRAFQSRVAQAHRSISLHKGVAVDADQINPSATTSPEGSDQMTIDPLLSSPTKRGERCPACESEVPFEDLRKAKCVNGHIWDRCALTFGIITSSSRTCLGCSRKAITPRSENEQEDPDIVELVVREARACWWCGGRWISR